MTERGKRAVVPVVVGVLLCAVVLLLATRAAGSPGVVVRSVSLSSSSLAAGQALRVTVRVRNRSANARRIRLVVRARRAAAPATKVLLGRKYLRRVAGGRTRKARLTLVVPAALAAGRYRIIACAAAGRRKRSCRAARRTLDVRRAVAKQPGASAPGAPAPGATPPRGPVHQTVTGFGSSARAFSDPHVFDVQGAAPPMTVEQQNAVLDALYVELGLTRIRPVQPDTAAGPPPVGIEVANDNADPMVTDLSRFTFGGRRLDDHAAVVARAQDRGVTAAWTSPLNREPWMGVSPGTSDAAEYAEWLLAQIRRFETLGARLDYVSVANEPSYSRNTMSGAFIRDVIKNLGPRLQAEGLSAPFVIPDDVRASDGAAKAAVVLADPVARSYVGALATHLYDEPLEEVAAMRALAEQHGLPLWMTESALGAMDSMQSSGTPQPLDWAVLMHELLATYNVGALDYFWGYIGADFAEEAALLRLNHDGTTYHGFSRTKVFYYFGQYSRFVRPGAVRVGVTSSDASVRTSAYHHGAMRTIVAINRGSAAVTTTLTAADLEGVAGLSRTRTSATENWAALPDVPVGGTAVTVDLPPHSVTTLTGTVR